MQEQKACDDIQQAWQDQARKSFSHQQTVVSGRSSRIRLCKNVCYRQAEAGAGNPKLYQSFTGNGHAFCPDRLQARHRTG